MTPENFNLNIQTGEGIQENEELKQLREELLKYKPLLEDAIKRQNLKEAETLLSKAKELKDKYLELKSKLENKGNITYEQYLSDIHPFLLETYKGWSYTEEQLKTVTEVTSNPDNIHIDQDIPYEDLKKQNADETTRESNKRKTGEIYLTSESIEYEGAQVFIPEIPDDIAKQGVSGVMQYIYDTYKDTHIIPDIKYCQYLAELSEAHNTETDPVKKAKLLEQIPEVLRDSSKYFYFPNSAFVNGSGRWVCPDLRWLGSRFDRSANGFDNGWGSSGRVVLLER